jgi:hypothetical protein
MYEYKHNAFGTKLRHCANIGLLWGAVDSTTAASGRGVVGRGRMQARVCHAPATLARPRHLKKWRSARTPIISTTGSHIHVDVQDLPESQVGKWCSRRILLWRLYLLCCSALLSAVQHLIQHVRHL